MSVTPLVPADKVPTSGNEAFALKEIFAKVTARFAAIAFIAEALSVAIANVEFNVAFEPGPAANAVKVDACNEFANDPATAMTLEPLRFALPSVALRLAVSATTPFAVSVDAPSAWFSVSEFAPAATPFKDAFDSVWLKFPVTETLELAESDVLIVLVNEALIGVTADPDGWQRQFVRISSNTY